MNTVSAKKTAAALLAGCRDVAAVERACVAGYMEAKGIPLPSRSYLGNYLCGIDGALVGKCRQAILAIAPKPTLDTIVELFELLVACETRKKNGVAYTPLSVKRMMLDRVLHDFGAPTVFDPSCGCASFLLTASQMIHERTGLRYSEVVRRCIFGADIEVNCI